MKPARLAADSWSLLFAAALFGCALDRGSGFSKLDVATLEISLKPGAARDLGDGKVLTDQGYEVAVDRAVVLVQDLQMQQVNGPSGDLSFDPANPPPGYGSCHSDHCHRDDGALISYEEIELELLGGKEAFSELITLGFEEPVSLLAGRAALADSYRPSRELKRGLPRRVVLTLSRLELEGSISGGTLGEDEIGMVIELGLGSELDALLNGPRIDRDGPERVGLHTKVSVDGKLFDGIDFSALTAEGRVLLDDPDTLDARTLVAALGASETSATLERR